MKSDKKPAKALVPKKSDRTKVLGNVRVSDRGADCTCYTSCTRC